MKYLANVSGAALLCAELLGTVLVSEADDGSAAPAWATPGATALKRVSPVIGAQHEPNFLSNLDCALVDYRLVAGGTMQTGCFTPTSARRGPWAPR